MPIYEIPNNTDVTITVKRDKNISRSGKGKKKSILKSRRNSDVFSRRSAKLSGITFYDLGDRTNGSSPFAKFEKPIDFTMNGSGAPAATVVGDLDSTYSDLQSQVLAVSDPFTSFRKILETSGTSTNVVVSYVDSNSSPVNGTLDGLDAFQSGVLTIKNDELASLSVSGGNIMFSGEILPQNADTNFKVTLEPSFDSDAVTFTRSTKMDIAIMPTLCYHDSFCFYPHPTIGGVGQGQHLNMFWCVTPRSLAPGLFYTTDYKFFYDITQAFKTVTGARGVKDDTDGVNVLFFPITASEFLPPAYFPAPPATPNESITLRGVTLTSFGVTYRPVGALVAIIRKSGVIHYVWAL